MLRPPWEAKYCKGIGDWIVGTSGLREEAIACCRTSKRTETEYCGNGHLTQMAQQPHLCTMAGRETALPKIVGRCCRLAEYEVAMES